MVTGQIDTCITLSLSSVAIGSEVALMQGSHARVISSLHNKTFLS